MATLEFKKNKENYELNVFDGRSSKGAHNSSYRNIIDRDPKKISQILIDLNLFGFPIDRAVKLYLEKMRNKDWLGL